MATFTRTDLIKRVLQTIRSLGTGQSPNADDADVVGEKLDNLQARLEGKGLTNDGNGAWTIETVPDTVAEPYIVLGTALCVDAFHVPENRIVRLRVEALEAENEIRRQVAVFNDREPVKAEQF